MSSHIRPRNRRTASVLAAALLGVSAVAVPVVDAAGGGAPNEFNHHASRPHVLTTRIADLIVRVRGGATCSGTPITGTTFVVTAAHCVLDHNGQIGSRTVLRDGVEYTPVSVLVNPKYHATPGPQLDAAVLVFDQPIPGPSATIGETIPTSGLVTLAGFQPLDTDGSLLRGTRYDNRPLPKGTIGGVVTIKTAAAGCVQPVSELEITDTQVKVPCGLIPGASGGGLFVEHNGEQILVGITSTVAPDLAYNGLVPLERLHNLLKNGAAYTHTVPLAASTHSNPNVARS